MVEFVEKNNGPSKKKIFRQMDRANITDIPIALQPNINNITLTYKDHYGFELADLNVTEKKYLIKNLMKLAFSDLVESNFTLEINVAEKSKEISEDEKFTLNEKVQKDTEEMINSVDDSAKQKESEVLSI